MVKASILQRLIAAKPKNNLSNLPKVLGPATVGKQFSRAPLPFSMPSARTSLKPFTALQTVFYQQQRFLSNETPSNSNFNLKKRALNLINFSTGTALNLLEFDTTAEKFLRAVSADSHLHLNAQYLRGLILLQEGNYEEALKCFTFKPAEYKNNLLTQRISDEVHLWKGIVLLRLRRYQEALESLEQFPDKNKFSALAHFTKGQVYIYLNEGEKALECFKYEPQGIYEAMITGQTFFMQNLLHQAFVQINLLHNHTEALACLKQITEENTHYPEAQCLRAQALVRLERYQEALACLENIPDEHEKYIETQLLKIKILVKMKHNLSASVAVGSLGRFIEREVIALKNKGSFPTPTQKKQYMEFSSRFDQLSHASKTLTSEQKLITKIFSEVDDKSEQIEVLINEKRYEEALTLFDDFPPEYWSKTRYFKGALLNKLKRYEEALPYFDQVHKDDDIYMDAQFYKGDILVEFGCLTEALKCFKQIPENSEHGLLATLRQSMILRRLNRYAEALEHIKPEHMQNQEFREVALHILNTIAQETDTTVEQLMKRYSISQSEPSSPVQPSGPRAS